MEEILKKKKKKPISESVPRRVDNLSKHKNGMWILILFSSGFGIRFSRIWIPHVTWNFVLFC